MSGERRIHESIIAVKKIEHRAILFYDIEYETNRLLEHGAAQFIIECREAFPIDRVVFLETAEVEPVTSEFHRQIANMNIFYHSPRLRDKNVGPVQIAGG